MGSSLNNDWSETSLIQENDGCFRMNGTVEVTTSDSTSDSRLEKELRKQCRALQLALLEQKEDFHRHISSVAHDVRGCLTSALGYAELLKIGHNPEYVDTIIEIVNRVTRMLNHSVRLVESGQVLENLVEVDLNQIVLTVAASVIPPTAQIHVDPLPIVLADSERLGLVFQNLFLNAIEHGSATKIEVKLERIEGGFYIIIRNDGKPISEEVRSKVFVKRVTTKEGGGLGLSIVRRIISAHNWNISLNPSQVTSFRIFIPDSSVILMTQLEI